LAQDLGISDRVGFTDFVAEPAAAMRALDIVVHASTGPEPFGLVIAEAMACGRAVIASAAGGAAEIIDAEVNALAHSPGDAARLAEQIASLASNVELRQRLGQAGRATVQERFNRERLAKELAPIYSKLVQIEGKQSDTRVGAARPKSDDASINGSAGVARTSGRFDSGRIRGLDSLRFVCAMWVVFVHCGFFPLLDHVDKTKFAGKLFAVLYNNAFNASAAVIVFFVISGFCINYPYAKGRSLDPKSYFTRRYIRIITPMMVAILLARPLNIKLTLLSDSILWSLLAEEIYYVIYPLLLWTSRRFGWTKILVVAFGFSVGVILTNPGAGDYPSYGPQLNWLLGLPCWLLGCLLAQRVSSATASSVATASIWGWRMTAWGLSSFFSFLRFHSPVKHPWTLNLFAIFVYFWLARETAYYKQHKAPGVLEHAGKWSYSIYLMHLHGQAIFVWLAFVPFAAGMNWMINIAFVLLVSYTFYLIVERPSHLFARKIAHKLLRQSLAQTQHTLSETVPEPVADLTL
jgi:peptidoglycan/LPS O-acetylase OafA/YrhL